MIETGRGYASALRRLAARDETLLGMVIVIGPARSSGVAAIHAFARRVRDLEIGSPGVSDDEARALLRGEGDRFGECFAGRAATPEYRALGDAVRRFRLPPEPFRRMVDASIAEVGRPRHATWDDLERVCRDTDGSAGRLFAIVLGARGEEAGRYAETLGAAVRLTSVLRHVADDAREGRIRLPIEDLRRFRLSDDDLLAGRPNDRFRGLLEYEIQRALALYDDGANLLPLLPSRRARVAVRFLIDARSMLLRRIRENAYDPFTRPVKLGYRDRAALLSTAFRSAR